MAFDLTSDMSVSRRSDGRIDRISHPLAPYYGSGPLTEAAVQSPRALADQYLREVLPSFNLDAGLADGVDTLVVERSTPIESGPQLNFSEEKSTPQGSTVSYTQTILGLPVWGAGFAVRMGGAPLGVIGSQNAVAADLEVITPSAVANFLPESVTAETIVDLLRLEQLPTVTRTRLIVYGYDENQRGNAAVEAPVSDAAEACPTIPVPVPPEHIQSGTHYVATEVLFTHQLPGWVPLNWRAVIEPDSGAILRLDALVSCVDGFVLLRDPLTANGVDTAPSSAAAILDSLRSAEQLRDVGDDGHVHHLAGPYVRVANVSAPNVAPPTVPLGGVFDHSMPTDEFAAVNGYYHCDRCFRLLEDLGFDVPTYFDGTTFPVVVDHRATIGGQTATVNAQAPGTTTGQGSDGFRFALLAENATVGMAVEQRITWHEFGHALLWDHLHSPNFRFAHSPGDTIAAILLDPTSAAPDRGRTFPWTKIARRHDHQPVSGFAWGGARDDNLPVGHFLSADRAGYSREQILSSTLFRFYRSIGGGSSDVAERTAASHRTIWLLLETIASLSPTAQPRTAEDFLANLIETDLHAQSPIEPKATGLFGKVLRWSFERQGLFQPPGAPTPVAFPGQPPAIDIFIDDGRAGEYDEVGTAIVDPPGLRVRLQQQDGASSEVPQSGDLAFVYATIANRGHDTANNVVIRVRATMGDTDVNAPDWEDLAPPAGAGPMSIAPGGSVTVGPFSWQPLAGGDWVLLADADCPADTGLRSSLIGPCPALTLALVDNNVAARRVRVTN